MRHNLSVISVTLILITGIAPAQAPRYPTNLSNEQLAESLQRQMRDNGIPNTDLILALGASGNVQYVPVLKNLAKGGIHLGEMHQARAAQMALAKLGQRQELFEIKCELKQMSDKSAKYYALTEKLPYVGGWFAIQMAIDFLPDTPENHQSLTWADLLLDDSQRLAINLIPDLIPQTFTEPRNRFGTILPQMERLKGLNDKEVIDGWYKWVLDHKRDLENLQPTGTQVEYSKAKCDRYFRQQAREMKRERPPYN